MTDFEEFKQQKLAEGYDEVLLRVWEPDFRNEPHKHPFDTDALVAQGEFWLTVGDRVSHFRAGERFQLGRQIEHSERYGAEGAVFWAARRN